MRVVCIADFSSQERGFPDEIDPVKGQIYTVRQVMHYPQFRNPGYRLMEIVNNPHQYDGAFAEVCFDSSCFRPVTDISALTKLAKVRELEDA